MNPRWYVDRAIGDISEDGWEALMADEAIAHTNAGFQQVARQMYYGVRTAYSGALARAVLI
jgi:hypothetical protein